MGAPLHVKDILIIVITYYSCLIIHLFLACAIYYVMQISLPRQQPVCRTFRFLDVPRDL